MLQGGEQAVVSGRDKGNGDLLAGEVGDFLDTGAVAGDESLGFADQANDEDCLDRQLAAGGGCKRA